MPAHQSDNIARSGPYISLAQKLFKRLRREQRVIVHQRVPVEFRRAKCSAMMVDVQREDAS